MRSATGALNDPPASPSSSYLETPDLPLRLQAPVAIARLRPSSDYDDIWVLDCMRSILKKETMDATCDGGSEHNEALAVAIDALLQHHLQNGATRFERAIRTKATLFSASLLEDRGFVPVTSLAKDMASHVSSLDACLEKYAERSVSTTAKTPGSRQRALEIVSLLGRLDRQEDLQQAAADNNQEEEEDIDPWSGMKRFL